VSPRAVSSVTPTVLYGICGEGLGHFSRAAFLVPRLLDAGYAVELFASGRVEDLCDERFRGCRVHHIPGLRMRYRDNALDVPGTFLSYARILAWWPRVLSYVAKRARPRRPVAAISDYEPVVAWAASAFRIPLIALDHQQVATECELESASPNGLSGQLLRLSNRMTYLRPRLRIITSFFPAPLRARRRGRPGSRTIVGPVLRPEVVQRCPTPGSHVVVYQTSRTFEWLDRILSELPGEKRVYGVGREQSGLPERTFSEDEFLDDLASCRFALVNGGHTTISEALYFGKPVLCFPVQGQAEQELNAHHVAKMGFGSDYRVGKGDVPDFRDFLRREEAIRQAIARDGQRCGNDDLVGIVLSRLTRWSRTR